MISNSQGVSAANGHSSANGNAYDPGDVRDALEPGLFWFLAAVQVRR